jgi:anti-sigma B factor antagonist
MENIRIETALRRIGHISILDVVGEIDIYTTPQFKEAIKEAIGDSNATIIVNMSRVAYMDSSGFGTLLSATKRLRPMNGSLSLVGCNDAINRMLQITRLNTIFGVYDTEEQAVADLTPGPGPSALTRQAAEGCVAMAR